MSHDDLLQVLDKDAKSAPNLSKTQLLEIYRVMVTARAFDERAMKLQRQGRIGFHVPAFGQEAASIGAAAALEASDWIFPSYRSPGIPILRGVPIVKMLNNLYGNAGDTSLGRQMPVHYSFKEVNFVSISSPIGTQIVQAAGAAHASKIRKDGNVVLSLFGDGATSSNDFHTGLNFAGVFKAPVIFFCENNQWAISLNVCGQTGSARIVSKAEGYGMPGIFVDGNDVLAVFKAVDEAVRRARAGEGPTLIEALTYRMGPHSSSDDPSRYRPDALTEEWRKKDPIDRFKNYLMKEGHLDAALDAQIAESAKNEIDEAVKEAEAIGAPAPETMFDGVWSTIPPMLAEQKAELLRAEAEHSSQIDPDAAFPL